MWANVDIIISAIAVCAVSTTVAPDSALPWRFWCGDLVLFFAAIGVYTLVTKHCTPRAAQGKCLPEGLSSKQDAYFPVPASHNLPHDIVSIVHNVKQQHQPVVHDLVALMRTHACQRNIQATLEGLSRAAE